VFPNLKQNTDEHILFRRQCDAALNVASSASNKVSRNIVVFVEALAIR
jgi:hypothetical protein